MNILSIYVDTLNLFMIKKKNNYNSCSFLKASFSNEAVRTAHITKDVF